MQCKHIMKIELLWKLVLVVMLLQLLWILHQFVTQGECCPVVFIVAAASAAAVAARHAGINRPNCSL